MRRELILVRHGECHSNRDNIFQTGQQYKTDPLSEKGLQQASTGAQRFVNVPVDIILCSSYLRARMTAQPISEITKAKVIVPVIQGGHIHELPPDDPALGEHPSLLRELDNPTELAGLSYHDQKAEEIKVAIKANEHDPDWHYSDEENLHEVMQRAKMIHEYLHNRTEKTIVVVSHGGILKAWYAQLVVGRLDHLSFEQKVSVCRSVEESMWWDNTGAASFMSDGSKDWTWLPTDISHMHPKYFNFMPEGDEEQAVGGEDTGTYLE